MKKAIKFSYFSSVFLVLISLNLYLSNLITYKLSKGWHFSNELIRLVYAENTGAAFSIMKNSTTFLMILSVIALLAILFFIIRKIDKILTQELLFLGFLTAGIFGNLWERFFLGHVRDFFDLKFIDFPIFNIGDIFINIGVLGMIMLILVAKKANNG